MALPRLAPWPSGLLGDFSAAVDRVLQAEEEEISSPGSGAWKLRRHTKALGSAALKLQPAVGQRFVELELQLSEAQRPKELDAVVPIAWEASANELQDLSDFRHWDGNGSLLQDVGSLRAGWCLFGGEDLGGKLCRLRGGRHQAALRRLEEMSRWHIPSRPAEFQCSLAVGIPILEATCHQMRLLEAWVERQDMRRVSEQWCSRSFAVAMLAVSTSQEKRRQMNSTELGGREPLLPAHYEDPPVWRAWVPPKEQVPQAKSKPPPAAPVGGSQAQNVAFWLAPKVPAPPPPRPPAPSPSPGPPPPRPGPPPPRPGPEPPPAPPH